MAQISFIPEIWVDELPPSERVIPWWLCVRPEDPAEPVERLNPAMEFIAFINYDPDHRYPLASSRVPSKIVSEQSCFACGPDIIELTPGPGPDPDPDDVPPMFVTFGEGLQVFTTGWDEGWSRDSEIFVYQGDSHIATLNFSYDDSATLQVWGGDLSFELIGQNIVLRQNGWEITRNIMSEFFLMDVGKAQIHPSASYVSSTLALHLNAEQSFSSSTPVVVMIRGEVCSFWQELIDGTYTWMFSDNFPVGLNAEPVTAVQDTTAFVNAFLTSSYHYPTLTSYTGVFSDSNLRTGFNGFVAADNETITLERGENTYTGTRSGSHPSNYQYTMSPTPPQYTEDVNNRWTLIWDGGSCEVLWGNYL